MQVPDDELPAQIGEIVAEIILSEQVQLDDLEYDQIRNLLTSDIMERRTKIQNKMVESGATRTRTSPGKRS